MAGNIILPYYYFVALVLVVAVMTMWVAWELWWRFLVYLRHVRYHLFVMYARYKIVTAHHGVMRLYMVAEGERAYLALDETKRGLEYAYTVFQSFPGEDDDTKADRDTTGGTDRRRVINSRASRQKIESR